MIDFKTQRIVRGELSEPIKRWVTWWKVPFGYVESIDELLKVCEESQIEPNMAAYPVPVAQSATTYEVYER